MDASDLDKNYQNFIKYTLRDFYNGSKDLSLLDSEECCSKIRNSDKKPSVKKCYAVGVLSLLKKYNSPNQVVFRQLCKDMMVAINIEKTKKKVVDFQKIVEFVEEHYPEFPYDVMVYSLMIMSNVKGDIIRVPNDKEIGVLRPSDICKTELVNNGGSYLDIQNMLWHIESTSTKNKVSRDIDVPEYFVDNLECMLETDQKYLISSTYDNNIPMKPETYAARIRRWLGFGATEIRSSYVSWRSNFDVEGFTRVVEKEGHCTNTAIAYYVKPVDEDDDGKRDCIITKRQNRDK